MEFLIGPLYIFLIFLTLLLMGELGGLRLGGAGGRGEMLWELKSTSTKRDIKYVLFILLPDMIRHQPSL